MPKIWHIVIGAACYGLLGTAARAQGSLTEDEEDNQGVVDQSDPEADDSQSQEDLSDFEKRTPAKKRRRGATTPSPVEAAPPAPQPSAQEAPNPRRVRRFHEVLDELLAEFGYDVKNGQIKGLANVSIRRVRVSQAIPKSYEEYIETLLAERIREAAQVRIISCVPCKTKTSSMVDGRLTITSPTTNLARLDAAAQALGIENFIDAIIVYHPTHMVLAIDIFNAQSKELVWAKTYNSETIRSRYQKLAVDYSQVAKSRPTDEYVPEYRFMIGLGGGIQPNVGGSSRDNTMVHLQIRAMEKFNNRKDEFGLALSHVRTTKSLLKSYPSETEGATGTTSETAAPATSADSANPKPKPYTAATGLLAMYSHLWLGRVESYDRLRHGMHLGVGALFTTGYLAPTVRTGWDFYLGRRFVTTVQASYTGASSITLGRTAQTTAGGIGGDLLISMSL